jgi:hypothetical protein
MTKEDALKTSQELDRAAKCLGGYREQVLNYASGWDNWYFPENKFYLLTLFVTYSKMILETRCEDARYGYKTKGNHPKERYA